MIGKIIKAQFNVLNSAMEPNLFSKSTLDILNKAIGGLKTLKNKRVITTTIVASLSEEHLDDLRVINKVPGCPNPPEDWFIFMFLRAHCRSLINTGNTLRAEKDFFDDSLPGFFGHKDIERYFYFGNDVTKNSEEIEDRPGKPMLIMTKKTTAEDIKSIPFYRCLGYHHLVEKTPDLEKHKDEEEFKEFIGKHRISIVEDPMPGFPEAVNYLLEKRKYDSVLVEAGLTLIGKYLSDIDVHSPFDLIVLSVYSGKIEKEWVGHSYPSMSKLLAKHDILYKSPPFPHKDGALTIYCLTKKQH